MLKPKIFQIGFLIIVILTIFYLYIQPSIRLKCPPTITKVSDSQKEVAKLDLKNKIYPEIRARMAENSDWYFRKFTLMGGLLGALLFKLPMQPMSSYDDLRKSLKSGTMCVILGLACIVAFFIDTHIRGSVLVIMELGTWANNYGIPAASSSEGKVLPPESFFSWEQFIRLPPPKGGMQNSFTTAIQMGALNFITIALFSLYYVVFFDVCQKGLDWLNGLIALLVLLTLGFFSFIAHNTSDNFSFTEYSISWRIFQSNYNVSLSFISWEYSYLIAWFVVVLIFLFTWGVGCSHLQNPIDEPVI